MFPEAERLLRLLEGVAETQRESAHTLRLLAEQQLKQDGTIGSLRGRAIKSLRPASTAQEKHLYQPRDEEFRTWSSFRGVMQRHETRVRRERQLPASTQVSKKDIFLAGGPAGRTVERILETTYKLPPKLWPPSLWPEELPRQETNGHI
jgi:hypothetical protein